MNLGMLAGLAKGIPGPEMLLQLLSAGGYLDNPVHERMAERLLGGKLSGIKVVATGSTCDDETLTVTAEHPDGELRLMLFLVRNPKKTLDAPQTP